MVSLLALMILCGFLLIVRGPFWLEVFFLFVSFLCLVIVTVMTVQNYTTVFAHATVKVRMSNYFSSKQTHRKATLLVQLLIIMWYYPLVWILGAVRALDANYTYAAYMIGSIFGKVIFSSLVIESHVSLLYEFLITTAHSANLGEEDRVIDTSVSPKFPRNSTSTSITFPLALRGMLPKVAVAPAEAELSAGVCAGVCADAYAEEDAVMTTIPEEGEVEEFPA